MKPAESKERSVCAWAQDCGALQYVRGQLVYLWDDVLA